MKGDEVRKLIERSSFGSDGARALRMRGASDPEILNAVLRRDEESSEPDEREPSQETGKAHRDALDSALRVYRETEMANGQLEESIALVDESLAELARFFPRQSYSTEEPAADSESGNGGHPSGREKRSQERPYSVTIYSNRDPSLASIRIEFWDALKSLSRGFPEKVEEGAHVSGWHRKSDRVILPDGVDVSDTADSLPVLEVSSKDALPEERTFGGFLIVVGVCGTGRSARASAMARIYEPPDKVDRFHKESASCSHARSPRALESLSARLQSDDFGTYWVLVQHAGALSEAVQSAWMSSGLAAEDVGQAVRLWALAGEPPDERYLRYFAELHPRLVQHAGALSEAVQSAWMSSGLAAEDVGQAAKTAGRAGRALAYLSALSAVEHARAGKIGAPIRHKLTRSQEALDLANESAKTLLERISEAREIRLERVISATETAISWCRKEDESISAVLFMERSMMFVGLDMHGLRLAYMDFAGLCLYGVNFVGADLTGVDFSGTDLTGARFSSACLSGVIWTAQTSWPDSYREQVKDSSVEVKEGLFRVRDGTERVRSEPVPA